MLDGNKSRVSSLYKPVPPGGCILLLQVTDWLENAAIVTTLTDKYVYVHVPCVYEDVEMVHRPSLPPLLLLPGLNCWRLLGQH